MEKTGATKLHQQDQRPRCQKNLQIVGERIKVDLQEVATRGAKTSTA